jgi:hypothetical protein
VHEQAAQNVGNIDLIGFTWLVSADFAFGPRAARIPVEQIHNVYQVPTELQLK